MKYFGSAKEKVAFGGAVLAGLGWEAYLVVRADCLPKCSYPDIMASYAGFYDIANWSREIAHGTSPLIYPDPLFRYLHLVPFQLLGELLGLGAKTVTFWYSLAFEFILIPAVLYLLVRDVVGRDTAVATLVVYVVFLPFVPPWDERTMLIPKGFAMYSYAIPPMLLAYREAARDRGLYAGIWLGVVSQLQIVLAGVAALSVAGIFTARRSVRDIVRAALVSMIIASPLLIVIHLHTESWSSRGIPRSNLVGGPPEPIVSVFEGLFLIAVLSVCLVSGYLYVKRQDPVFTNIIDRLNRPLFISALAASSLTLFSMIVMESYWYNILFGYASKFVLAAAVGDFLVVLNSHIELVVPET